MNIRKAIAATIGFALVPTFASAAVIGGTYYAPQYDWSEFFAVADHHDFHVVLAGNPFPGSDMGATARDLLPAMQAAKPRPALTFAYDVAAPTDQPDYRLVLIFDPARDLGSKEVCNGVSRFEPGQPGRFYAYAVYCRNNVAMSETTAWTSASASNDPRIESLFRQLFMVVWPDSHAMRPQTGEGTNRR